MYHCEAALAADPATILRYDSGIVKNCRLVQKYATAMDRPGEWDLVRMKEVET